MGVVVWSAKSRVTHGDAVRTQDLGKISTELWSVVSLHHAEVKAKVGLCLQYCLCSLTREDARGYLGIAHAGMEIYDRVDILPFGSVWTDVVNSICLHQLTGFGDMWSSWVIWSYSFLPGSIEAVVPPQDAAHTAQAESETL